MIKDANPLSSVLGAGVSLTDFGRTTRIVYSVGYYSFAELNAGKTYVLSVFAKKLNFTPQTQLRSIVEDT
jgi:hypothetical protein